VWEFVPRSQGLVWKTRSERSLAGEGGEEKRVELSSVLEDEV
jgi:hypothetical protein